MELFTPLVKFLYRSTPFSYALCYVTPQLVPRRKWFPGPSMAIFVAVDGSPGPIMAATDGPPLLQVVSQYISILYNF